MRLSPHDLFSGGEAPIFVDVVCKPCPFCHRPGLVHMPWDAFEEWREGTLIWDAWPEGTEADRNLLSTGIDPQCWEERIKPLEFDDFLPPDPDFS